MDMHKQTSNMYRDNLDMTSNMMGQEMRPSMMNQNMMGQEMRSNMRDVHRQNQALAPNQYFEKDDFGNYVYSYNDQLSEKSEEGNGQAIKGHYAYIMSNGVKRRVDYVADNQGFHILQDNADPARIKRSVEPNLVQTKMTSFMDRSSLRDATRNMHGMSNMVAREMMDRNSMGMDQQKYSNDGGNMMDRDILGRNSMGRDMMDHTMINQDIIGHNMMGQQDTMRGNMMGGNIYNLMSNRGMTSDMSDMMSHNLMGKQQMHSNMMGREMTSNMMNRNMLGQQEMTPNMMYRNMMDLSNNQMSSNMLNRRGMSSDMMNSNSGLMGQRMMQKMEIEHIPETYTSTRFF